MGAGPPFHPFVKVSSAPEPCRSKKVALLSTPLRVNCVSPRGVFGSNRSGGAATDACHAAWEGAGAGAGAARVGARSGARSRVGARSGARSGAARAVVAALTGRGLGAVVGTGAGPRGVIDVAASDPNLGVGPRGVIDVAASE